MSALATLPKTFYRAPLRAGDAGTAQTIEKIRELVNEAWSNGQIATYALNVIRNSGVQQYDELGQIRAIYADAKSFYFINDPYTKEALHPAEDLINWRAGDCDDINAILLPSVLGAAGFPVRLVTVAADARDPNQFSHIYCEVQYQDKWIALDAARPGAAFGLAPQKFFKRWWWSLEYDQHENYPGPGQITNLNQGMGRYRRRTMGDASSNAALESIMQELPAAVSPILQAVNGQPVVSAFGAPIGPGGYSIPPAPTYYYSNTAAPSGGNTGILILLGLGLLALAGSK